MKSASVYRLSIGLSGLALAAQTAWERFIEDLESTRPEVGSVLSWEGEDATHGLVVLSVEQPSAAVAAGRGVAAVAESLDRAGQGHIYPAQIHVDSAILS